MAAADIKLDKGPIDLADSGTALYNAGELEDKIGAELKKTANVS